MDEIHQLVESVKKHAGFKRLAAYSIQSLVKKCTPPSNGWMSSARSAYDAGAGSAIATVVARNSRDSELLLLCVTQLQAAAVAGLAATVIRDGTAVAVVTAFQEYMTAAELPSAESTLRDGLIVAGGTYAARGPDAEAVAVTESLLRLLSYLALAARAEAATFAAALLSLLPRLPTPSAVRTDLAALDALVRGDEGFTAILAAPERVAALLGAASTVFVAPLGSHQGPLARLNAHLEPAFRVLDKLTRSTVGLAALRAQRGAAGALATAVEAARGPGVAPGTGPMAVRVIARLLGDDVDALIGRIEVATTAPAAAPKGDAELAAAQLAALMLDPEIAGRIALQPPLLARIVGLLDGPPHAATRVATSVATALRRFASHSVENASAALEAGAVRVLSRAATSSGAMTTADALPLAAAALAAAAELLRSPRELAIVEAEGGVDTALRLLARDGATNATVASACLHLINAATCAGYSPVSDNDSALACADRIRITSTQFARPVLRRPCCMSAHSLDLH